MEIAYDERGLVPVVVQDWRTGEVLTLAYANAEAVDRTRATALEPLLRRGLDEAGTTSLKSAWFNALRSVALTPATLQWLERVWSQAENVPGLVLAEPDYITLAQELAVRGVADAEKILDQQIARTTNPDRKARMQFVRPALSADQAVRDRFFASLKDVANRRREAWVLDALDCLHHPLRAASSRKYVRPSLDMLTEIQRTGDIFFPKRWTDATLGGYQSLQTAADVRAFIDALPPDYPPRLRWVLLSAADQLFRAAKLRTTSSSSTSRTRPAPVRSRVTSALRARWGRSSSLSTMCRGR